jgi:hypothetical protein
MLHTHSYADPNSDPNSNAYPYPDSITHSHPYAYPHAHAYTDAHPDAGAGDTRVEGEDEHAVLPPERKYHHRPWRCPGCKRPTLLWSHAGCVQR